MRSAGALAGGLQSPMNSGASQPAALCPSKPKAGLPGTPESRATRSGLKRLTAGYWAQRFHGDTLVAVSLGARAGFAQAMVLPVNANE